MRDIKRIDVIVISTPGSNRVFPLLEQLGKSNLFEIHILEAVMYSAEKFHAEIDQQGQQSIYGRKLADGEIGCAISHQKAYAIIKEIGNSAIILEDDARIPDLENFEKLALLFMSKFSDGSHILSLLPWEHKNPCRGNNSIDLSTIFFLSGTSPLTVGYAITLDAARELASANPGYKFLADWPPSRVKYLSSIIGVINHGDEESGSTIQEFRDTKAKTEKKGILEVVILGFLRHKREFKSYSDYFKLKINPSVTWRIDDFRAKRIIKKLES